MRHRNSGKKLGRTASHKEAMLRNMASSLFEHKKIKTTEAKAKELRPYAEKLITRAKNALLNEKKGQLPEGQTIDLHSRREVGRFIRQKGVLQELFDSIAPVVLEREGGYTRIVKTGIRRGDAGATAIIELVDWANKQDGVVSLKKKKAVTVKKKATTTKKAAAKAEAAAPVAVAEEAKAPVEEVVAVEETIVEVAEVTPEVETTPEVAAAEEAPAVDEAPAAESTEENTEEKA